MTPETIIGEHLRGLVSPAYTVYQAMLPSGYRNDSEAIVYTVASQDYPYVATADLGRYTVYVQIYGGSDDWQDTDELRESFRRDAHGTSDNDVRQCIVTAASQTRSDPVTGWPVAHLTLQFRLRIEDE